MSAISAAWPRAMAAAREPDPRWAIFRHVVRRGRRWAILWGVLFGLQTIATVRVFVAGYPTARERLELAASLQSFAIFFGPARHVETTAGFTSWRLLMVFAIVGAIWGLMTSTGLLRGEEDAGRWEILLAGQTTKRWAATQALLGLGALLLLMLAAMAVLTLLAGRMPGARFPPVGSLLFAIGTVSGAAMFLAIGALASQLSATRGQAATIAAVVLGGSYLLRMVADSQRSLNWLRWLTPMGWVEELRPLAQPQPWALIPMVGLVAASGYLTLRYAERRDLYDSVLRERESKSSFAPWLVGPAALAAIQSRRSAFGWLVGIALMGLTYGSLVRSAASILSSSETIATALGRLGVRKAAEGYLGVVFLVVAVFVAILAASQVAGIRDEEASGRLDNLLVRPVRRVAWLAGRLSISLALVVLAGVLAGTFTWLGASGQHIGVTLPRLVGAGLNASAPGVFVLGAGALVIGVRPHFAAAAAYGLVAWSFLVNMLGALIKGSTWLRDSSIFSHIALVPAANPDWGGIAGLLALGAGMAALGALAFQRRDIEYA